METVFLLQLFLGGVLVLLGRRLFWLFVGAVGFVVGVALASHYFSGAAEAVLIAIGLVAGIVCALLAVFFQQFAVSAAGFLSVGYLAARLAASFGFETGFIYWLAFIMGGVAGVFLVNLLFDWALVVLSTIAGTYLIVQALTNSGWLASSGNNWLTWIIVIVLLALGVMIQSRGLIRKK